MTSSLRLLNYLLIISSLVFIFHLLCGKLIFIGIHCIQSIYDLLLTSTIRKTSVIHILHTVYDRNLPMIYSLINTKFSDRLSISESPTFMLTDNSISQCYNEFQLNVIQAEIIKTFKPTIELQSAYVIDFRFVSWHLDFENRGSRIKFKYTIENTNSKTQSLSDYLYITDLNTLMWFGRIRCVEFRFNEDWVWLIATMACIANIRLSTSSVLLSM